MKTIKLFVAGALSLLLHSNGLSAPPSQPQNLQQAWLGSESLLLWDETPDATSYNVYRSDNTNTTWVLVGSSAVPRFRDTTYQFLPSFYTVTAVNADGESTGSDLSTVSYVEPYMISVSEPQSWYGTLSPTNAVIQWTTSDPSGAQGIVDWGLDSTNFNFFAINTNYLGSQRFDLTNLTPLTIYHYRLTSISSNRSGVVYLGYFGTPDTNHPPVAENYTSTWPAPTNGAWIYLRGYDSNQPPQALAFRITTSPTNGTLSAINPGWEWNTAYVIYMPAPGARGYDHFWFVVNNGTWDSAPALVTITNWINTPPAITNGYVTTPEDTPIALTLPQFDAEGDPITFTIPPWSASRGTITGTPPNVIFIPETNFNGSGAFSYTVTDGYEQSFGWFQINVSPVNDKPELRTNFMSPIITSEDWPAQISIWVYDEEWISDYEFIVVTNPVHGTLGAPGWNITYTPETNFYGTDSFTLVVREPDGTTSDPQTYFITVTPLNDEPIGFDQDVTMLEDTTLIITPTGADVDGTVVTFRVHWGSWPMHGWVHEMGTNFIYHPGPDFNGTDEFQFDAIDDTGFSSWFHPGTVRLQVLPVGETPAASVSWATAHQDAFVNSFFRVVDVDSATLTCEVLTLPTNGTVTVSGTNFLYQPAPGYQGNDLFTYRVFDGEFYSGVTNVYIWVNGPNTAPEAAPQTISAVQNIPVWTLLSVFDPDGDWLTAILVDAPQHGTVVFDGIYLTYSPTNDFYGTDSFTYQPFDGVTNGNTTLVTINVALPNVAPVAYSTNLTTVRDVALSFTLLAADGDGDALTYILTSSPANGTLSGAAPNLVYTPASGFMGTDSFTFKANDGTVDGNTATVTITTTRPNVAPTAASQSVTTAEDNSIAITLGGSDGDGDPLTFTILSGPSHGSLSGSGANRTYTPAANYHGADSFTFTVNDGLVDGNTATVSLTLTPVNDAPVLLNPTTIRTLPEEWVTSWHPAATDPDGDPLTFRLVTPPSHGTLDTTNWLYRAPKDYNGGDYFSWVVNDGTVDSALGTFSISITPVNDAPVASNQTVTVDEDISTVITPLVSDVDNSSLTLTVITQPQHGTVTVNGMTFTYQPVAGYNGSDSFSYRASDGSLNSGTATVSITVTPINNPPVRVSADRGFTITEDWYSTFNTLASDADGDVLTYRIVTQPTNGTVTQLTSNTWRYQPAWNWYGDDLLTWVASDGQVDCAIGTVWFHVVSENDRPLTGYDWLTNAEDTVFAVTLWSSDVEGSPLTYTILTLPTNGVLSGSGSNRIYTPNPDFVGGDSLTYKVNDGQLDSTFPGTILFTVTNMNDAPVANSLSISTVEDIAVNITLTASDVDNDPLNFSIINNPAHGTLSGAAPNLVYSPAPDYYGNDSFVFSVSDGITNSTATVSITVTPVNDLPAPDGLHRRIYIDDGIVRLWWNAVPGAQSYSVYRADTNSPFTLLASGITETNFNDTNALWQQTYWYRITTWDGTAEGAPSNPVLARRDGTGLITTYEENWLILGTTARVQFCSSLVSGTEGLWEYGTTTNYDRVLENTNLLGCHNFNLGPLTPQTVYYYRLTATDSNGNAAAYWNSLTTHGPPTADPQSASMPEDSTRDFVLVGHEGGFNAGVPPLIYSIVSGPSQGTLTALGGQTFRYRPATNYNGPDSFTFKVNDSDMDSAPATVSITVTPVNDPPVITVPTPSNNWQITRTTAVPTWTTEVPTRAKFEYWEFTHGYDPINLPNYATEQSCNVSGLWPSMSYGYRITVWTAFNDSNSVSGSFQTLTNRPPTASNQVAYVLANTATNIVVNASDPDGTPIYLRVLANPTNGFILSTNTNSFRYLPASNFTGGDRIVYVADDWQTTSQVAVVTIYVFPPNGAPITLPYSTNTLEDVAVTIPFRGFDAQSNALTYSIFTGPSHGTFTVIASNVIYRPATNYNGTDSFMYRAFDGANFSAPANVSLTITPVNDRPIANNQSVTATEDVAQPITLTASDVDFNSLTYTVASGPAHGTLSGAGASRTYTPATNYNGPDSFTFFVNDGLTNSATATVTITVTAVNDAPIALPQSLSLGEDMEITFSVSGTDVDSGALSFEVVTSSTNGTLNIAGTNYTYRPATNFSGEDSLTFRAFDGALWSAPAIISITVTSVNDGPIAYAQSITLAEDGNRAIVLTGFDGDGETLAYSIVSSPLHGTLSGTPPEVTYQPDANYNGADSFTFQVTDGNNFSAPATVSISVSPINDSPVVTNRNIAATEDTPMNFTLTGSDVDGDTLTFRATSTPLHGTLTGTGPTFTYTPNANYAGTDSFFYTANDGAWDGNIAAVIITIASVNDAPSVTNQNIATMEDSSVTFAPLAADIEGDALTFTILTPPTNGVATVNAGNLVYTPSANYNGTDSFTFRANDSTTNSVTASVSITVTAVNDVPVANAGSRTFAEDTLNALVLSASDVDGDTLTFSIVNAPLHGTLSGTGASRTYTPTANYNGSDAFTFRAMDPSGASSDALFSITVTPANDRPVGTDETVDVVEETPLWFVPNATDVDGDSIGFVITQPVHGTAVVTNGGILYTPNTNYFGNDIVYYYPTDAISTGALTIVVFNITNVNDGPTANDRTATTAEDTAVNIVMTGSDPDNDALTFTIVSGPTNGTLSGAGASRTYTPAANYNGPDSFTYLVNDGMTNSTVATVNVTVTPVNDAPSLLGFATVIDEDTPITFTLTVSDADNDPLTYIITGDPSHGTLTGTGPTFTYTPSLNYNGPDQMIIKASDGIALSGNAYVSLTTRAINDSPVANPQTVSVNEDSSVVITLSGSDVEGGTLSYTRLSDPAHGTITGTPLFITSTNAVLTYTPAANYNGPDSFTFRVHDPQTAYSASATVTINVAAVNDAPVANPQSVTVTYNTAKAITLTGSDLEGSALTYSIVTTPTNGTLSGTAPNITYTPTVGSAGADRFTFRVNDGGSNSATATVSITTQNPTGISAAPTSLTITVPTAIKTLILNWSCTATNEDGFKIERSLNGSSGWSQIATTGINIHTFTNTGLTSNTRYYYRVRSYNRLGNSAYSNTVNAKAR